MTTVTISLSIASYYTNTPVTNLTVTGAGTIGSGGVNGIGNRSGPFAYVNATITNFTEKQNLRMIGKQSATSRLHVALGGAYVHD